MKKKLSSFSIFFIIVLFVFSAYMIWYIPSISSIQSSISETRQNLETSRGRERKQLDEYNKAVADLPLIKTEFEETVPLAAEAEQLITDLKARRKELRQEKKELEKILTEAAVITEEGRSDEK